MEKKNVKSNLLDHSEAKVRLLSEYLKRYLNIICNDGYTRRIRIFDVFCGEGLYENEGEGSPLVIMRCINDIHFTNVAKLKAIPPIDCRFNDIKPEKVEKAKQAIAGKSLYCQEFGNLEFDSLDYQVECKNLISSLSRLDKEKAFIFIDPYEYKHIKAAQIRDLMANGNTEVLLWLPTQFMYRFSKNGTPQALKDFIEELVPYKDWKATDSVWHFIRELRDGFQSGMGDNYFVDTFTIQKDANTVFCLFFFTSHIKGFEKMLEAKWEIDTEQGKGWEYSGNWPSLFHDMKTNPLEEKLILFLKEQPRSNGELYAFTLKQRFLPKHTFEILHNWQVKGKLDVQLANGQRARKGAFYLSYDYYNKESKKIMIKLI